MVDSIKIHTETNICTSIECYNNFLTRFLLNCFQLFFFLSFFEGFFGQVEKGENGESGESGENSPFSDKGEISPFSNSKKGIFPLFRFRKRGFFPFFRKRGNFPFFDFRITQLIRLVKQFVYSCQIKQFIHS